VNPQVRLPTALGNVLDAVTDADKAWFEQHPGKRWRVRPADPAECRLPRLPGMRAVRAGARLAQSQRARPNLLCRASLRSAWRR
jgi:hypothetical protein